VPVSEEYLGFVVDQLTLAGRISHRRMFGGVGIYVDGTICALISDDVLYLKVGENNRADFESVGCGPFRPGGGDGYAMNYYEVPAEVLEDAEELALWTHKAMAAGQGKKKRAPRR